MKKIIITVLAIFLNAEIIIYQKNFTIKKPVKSWIEIKNENLVRQKYDYSCGSAALATILKYFYDLNITEKDILNKILELKSLNDKKKKNYENKDFMLSFYDLARYIKLQNFKAVGLALDLESLSKLQVPVILYVKIRKNTHFTVFKGIDKNYVYLADPNFGNIKLKISKFKKIFYLSNTKYPGKVLAIIPKTKEQIKHINKNFMKIRKSSVFIYEVIKNNTIIFIY